MTYGSDFPVGQAERFPVPAAPRPVVELKDVTFRRERTEILRGVTFTVREGEHWALLGPNGSGKSTVLGLCGAVTHPTSGTVHVLGRQLGRVELQALRRTIGHVNPRHPLRSPLTVREVVLTGITGSLEVPLRWQPGPGELARAGPSSAPSAWPGRPATGGPPCLRASAGAPSSPAP